MDTHFYSLYSVFVFDNLAFYPLCCCYIVVIHATYHARKEAHAHATLRACAGHHHLIDQVDEKKRNRYPLDVIFRYFDEDCSQIIKEEAG